MAPQSKLDQVISLAKRRGFVFQAGEIYGGSRSAWDYGPLGVELKENIKREWWQTFVRGREDMVGLDSSIILPTMSSRPRTKDCHHSRLMFSFSSTPRGP